MAGSMIDTTPHTVETTELAVAARMSHGDHGVKETTMKTKLTVLAAAFVGLVMASAPAFAQDTKVAIPFAFTVMGRTLPAGVYQFTEQSPDVIKLESATFPALQVELPVLERLAGSENAADAKVVFNRTGRTDVLAQVWLDGYDGYVVSLPKY
jgi:hypothetical protein